MDRHFSRHSAPLITTTSGRSFATPAPGAGTSAESLPSTRADRARVLVVDDEPHVLHVVSYVLTQSGYSVVGADNGQAALELARTLPVGLVITDLQMPRLDGIGLARRLASDPETADIPVIFLTARSDATDLDRSSLRNVRDVVTKPFSPRALLANVSRLLPPPARLMPSEAA